MRISSTSLREIGIIAAGDAERASTIAGSQDSSRPNAPAQADGYSPSPGLTQLMTAAKQEPEIRPDVVREVSDRLSQGFYATSTNAENTAEALLHAIE